MLRIAFSAFVFHWKRHPLQFATLFISLSLATALWSSVQIINEEARLSYKRVTAFLGQDQLSQLVSKDQQYISEELFVKLRRGGWLVSPILEGQTNFGNYKVRIYGIDPFTAPPEAQKINFSNPNDLREFIKEEGALFVSAETENNLRGRANHPLHIITDIPPDIVITDIAQAQKLLNAQGKISQLLIWEKQPQMKISLFQLAPDLIFKEPLELSRQNDLTNSFHLNLTAFSFLSFAVGLFVVHSAVGLAFEQRLPIFRTLMALGLARNSIIFLFVCELLSFAFISGFIGFILGYYIASFLLPDVVGTLRGIYGANVKTSPSLQVSSIIGAILISSVGTLVCGAQLIIRLWILPILASAKPEAWFQISRRSLFFQILGSICLFVSCIFISFYGSGLFWSFMLLGSLLLASALILPLIIILFLGLGLFLAKSVLNIWFWSDTRQQLSGLSFSLMSLLLALAANIGVGTMVSSFRSTFTGWLDQRLASELYVSARTDAEGLLIQKWLTSQKETLAVLPISNIETEIEGLSVSLYGVANHATYRDNWPLIESIAEAWDIVAQGGGVLVNEQISRRLKIKLGDEIKLPTGRKSTVVGIYSDYGNPLGQILIGIETFNRQYPQASHSRFAIRTDPANVEKLAKVLQTQFSLPVSNIINQEALKKLSLKTFEKTFNITNALNILTLCVAGVSMFASLLTLSSMRIKQMAPLWAMGVTKSQLAFIEFVRNVFIAALTAILSVPVGLGVAWILLDKVNVEAFGWRIPMSFFPSECATLVGMAIFSSAVAALIPAWNLARQPTSQFLKVFSYEF